MEKYFTVNNNGCSIGCKLYSDAPAGIERVVLFGHGFGGNRDNTAAEKLAKRLISKNKGTALVIFDWPCHGGDVRKTLRLDDCDMYLRTMLEHVGTAFPGAELYGCATSFGGYLFLKYVSEHGSPFRRIALRCPAVCMYEVITGTIMTEDDAKKLEKGKPVSVGIDGRIRIDRAFVDSLKEADITKRCFLDFAEDILIIHGMDDEVVPFGAVERFADDNLIEFVPVAGADHRFRDPEKMEQVLKRFAAFFGMK
ncbi:MAG: alpha/beta fold hydrolase [Clostridia bacterium]|nr:alpha/beta fold hydrolase [Clostridia bacterium]